MWKFAYIVYNWNFFLYKDENELKFKNDKFSFEFNKIPVVGELELIKMQSCVYLKFAGFTNTFLSFCKKSHCLINLFKKLLYFVEIYTTLRNCSKY